MLTHKNIRVVGRVQGVFFREGTRQKASELGLAGFAQNELDGSVYIEVEGEEVRVEELIAWCRRGPPAARVERVEVSDGEFASFTDFTIRR